MFPSMHKVQFDIPNQLIYVVDLLYSTCFCLKMIETNKEFNLYILFFSFHQLTNKNTATLQHDSSHQQPMRKIMTHLSLIKGRKQIFFIECVSRTWMTLFSVIPLYYLFLIPSTIIIALTFYGVGWIGFQLFIHN